MLIIKTKGNRIEYALKEYKRKTRDTGLHRELNERKRFKKKSEKRRSVLGKAKYIQTKYKDNE